MKTFSVGFIGVDWSFRDEDNRWYGGREFSKTELLEISAVTVPANPNASVDGIKGVFGQDVKSVLDCGYFPEMTQGKGLLWLPVQGFRLVFVVLKKNKYLKELLLYMQRALMMM